MKRCCLLNFAFWAFFLLGIKSYHLFSSGRRYITANLQIMKSIHKTCVEMADRFGTPGNYVNGANIGGLYPASGTAGWILEQPHFQALLERYPLAEQTLDLFLKRAHISPHQETGRITFYLLNLPLRDGAAKPQPFY